MAGNWCYETLSSWQEAGGRKQVAGSRWQEAGGRKQVVGSRWQVTVTDICFPKL